MPQNPERESAVLPASTEYVGEQSLFNVRNIVLNRKPAEFYEAEYVIRAASCRNEQYLGGYFFIQYEDRKLVFPRNMTAESQKEAARILYHKLPDLQPGTYVYPELAYGDSRLHMALYGYILSPDVKTKKYIQKELRKKSGIELIRSAAEKYAESGLLETVDGLKRYGFLTGTMETEAKKIAEKNHWLSVQALLMSTPKQLQSFVL